MSAQVECRYYGRDFTTEEIALLRELLAASPPPNRHALSREFCRRIGWHKPDGGLKDMMARVTMLAMHNDGLIVLPPPKWPRPPRRPITFGPDTEPPLFPAPATLDEVRPLSLHTAVRYTRQGRLWNEFIARYHYLGYKTLVGAQIRYAVHDRQGRPLAMLGFSTAAHKLAPRDRFIGWTPQLRRKNLPLVIDNPRFLILPWITIPNLGSHILSLVRRQLPKDWTERYNTTPRPHRDLRRDPALHRRPLQGLGLDPRRRHPGPRPLRPPHQTRPARKGHLAPPPPKELAKSSQPVISCSHHLMTEGKHAGSIYSQSESSTPYSTPGKKPEAIQGCAWLTSRVEITDNML